MVWQFVDVFKRVLSSNRIQDDDFADRINYKYTVAVLVIFAIIVTNRQFGTKQIHCWIPAYFTRKFFFSHNKL